ncbi:unnamed protein product [Mycena citricolor]|uniref:Major facilitator superfamily (MFS) profile domain-containing protein n=1 Tax=Mycena citricolor TaxID=2018698 RepID=A0AAD2Q773_9AGAR|nr:unnamed protein product [Mycena citricolor]
MNATETQTETQTQTPAPSVRESTLADEPHTSHTPHTPPVTRDFGFLPIPERLRYVEGKVFEFGLLMNIALGFMSTFTMANLSYCQPLLINLAETFGVSYSKVSQVPTLLQAGYAVGVVFISPVGDITRRRPLLLLLMAISTLLTIGLAITANFVAFEVLSFFVGMTSIITAMLQPLAADLAPPHRRARAISVIVSGLLLGVLISRVLAGVFGQLATWRATYYFAVGIQALAVLIAYFFIPDCPPSIRGQRLSYTRILWTMGKFAGTEPALIQACLVNFATSAMFTSFWVTLTFLLGGPLFNYSTLDIGLFGFVGMAGVLSAPLTGRFIDSFVPWYPTFISVLALGATYILQTAAEGLNIGAVVVIAFSLNLFRQMNQSALATTVLSIAPEARSRFNAVNVLSLFLGQVAGTAAGTSVYLQHGWRMTGVLALSFSVWQIIVLLARGPHCERYTWFGWQGGWQMRKTLDSSAEIPEKSGDLEKSSAVAANE